MFKFHLNMRNPWRPNYEWTKTKTFAHFERKLFGTKAINFQISRFEPYYLFDISLNLLLDGHDHAGPELNIEIFGYAFILQLYDTRHWDYENERWEEPKQEA